MVSEDLKNTVLGLAGGFMVILGMIFSLQSVQDGASQSEVLGLPSGVLIGILMAFGGAVLVLYMLSRLFE